MRKSYLLLLEACVALMLAACRGNGDGQDAAVQDVGEELTSFYQANTDVQDEAKQKNSKALQAANPLEQPARMKNVKEVILRKKGYTVSYNTDTRLPNWVAWHLTAAHTSGSGQRSDFQFHEDVQLPAPRVTAADYYNSGFDRGHMCPAGDNKWSKEAMNETFLFTNICPQVHALNAGAWNDLEIACRKWAQKYGSVYIVCGPILDHKAHRTIGRSKVVVPERFFKVVLCTQGTPKAIGFVYENSSHNSRSMFKNATTVDEVERLTGIDFFPQLDDKTEAKVEAERGYF